MPQTRIRYGKRALRLLLPKARQGGKVPAKYTDDHNSKSSIANFTTFKIWSHKPVKGKTSTNYVKTEKTWYGDWNNMISWSALWPRKTKWDALAWIRGHQYWRGDSFGTTMVNENKALPCLAWQKNICVFLAGHVLSKNINPVRAQCWKRYKGRKWWIRTPNLSIGVKCHQVGSGASMQSLSDKMRESISLVERRGHNLQTEGNILVEEQFLGGIIQLFTPAPIFPRPG